MGDPVTDLVKCINPSANLDTFSGFTGIMTGFFTSLPQLITPEFAVDFVAKGPVAVIDLLIEAIKATGAEMPSFSFEFLGVKVAIPGVDLQSKYPGLDFPVFNPDPLIKFVIDLLKIQIGIPALFFDLETVPPTPKIPVLPDDLIELVGISINPDIVKVPGFETFVTDFPLCIVKTITGVLV